MAEERRAVLSEIGLRARGVAFALVGGVARLCGKPEFEQSLHDLPRPKQRRITVLALSGLLVASLLAAQFGWIGMLAFWLAAIVLVN
jgi:hypothetical protein